MEKYMSIHLITGEEVFGTVQETEHTEQDFRLHNPLVILKKMMVGGEEGKVLERYNNNAKESWVDIKLDHVVSMYELTDLMAEYYRKSLAYNTTHLDRMNNAHIRNILTMFDSITEIRPRMNSNQPKRDRIVTVANILDGNTTKH